MIKHIHSLYLKNSVISTDTRDILKKSIFFALKGDNFNANEFAKEALDKGASFAIIDEKKYQINNQTILVNNVLETLQKLATYHRNFLKIPIITLTGSNGKTTTKELINTVLSKKFKTTATKGNLNNHIGVPLTLLSMTKETEIGIVEMGANHSNEIDFLCNIIKPNYGYITNFGKAHLEGFGSIKGVIKAKTELYRHLKKNNKTVFINTNDQIQVDKSKGMEIIGFGQKDTTYPIKLLNANPFVTLEFNKVIVNSNMIGNYNYNNIAAAIAIGQYFNIGNDNIKTALENYNPQNNRSQIIQKNSTKIILDAYNANPNSMQSALDNLFQLTDKTKIAILGDMFELGKYAEEEHQKITTLVSNSNINKIYLVGENFKKTTSANTKKVLFLKDFEAFKNIFDKSLFKDTTVLIKASRGMALERITTLFD